MSVCVFVRVANFNGTFARHTFSSPNRSMPIVRCVFQRSIAILFVWENIKKNTPPNTNSSRPRIAYLSLSILLISYHQSCIISLLLWYNKIYDGVKINAAGKKDNYLSKQESRFSTNNIK